MEEGCVAGFLNSFFTNKIIFSEKITRLYNSFQNVNLEPDGRRVRSKFLFRCVAGVFFFHFFL